VEGLVAGAVGIGVTMVWYVKKMCSVEGGMAHALICADDYVDSQIPRGEPACLRFTK